MQFTTSTYVECCLLFDHCSIFVMTFAVCLWLMRLNIHLVSSASLIIYIRKCGMSAGDTTLHPSHNVWKVNYYMSKYTLQQGSLAHTEQQAIKDPKMTSVKQFKQENQRYNLYKKKRKWETLINHTNKRQQLNNMHLI